MIALRLQSKKTHADIVVAVVAGEQLHLTPISGVFQMRPSFAHIDEKEEAKKKKLNSEMQADTKVKKEEPAEEKIEV